LSTISVTTDWFCESITRFSKSPSVTLDKVIVKLSVPFTISSVSALIVDDAGSLPAGITTDVTPKKSSPSLATQA